MNFFGAGRNSPEESCRREVFGELFYLAGTGSFLGGITFLAGRWTDPVGMCANPVYVIVRTLGRFGVDFLV